MIKRVRDKIHKFLPKTKITFAEWQEILDRYAIASTILKEENPFYRMLNDNLTELTNQVVENRIHSVKEVHKISDKLKKIFFTPRKMQVDEVVGQIKFIKFVFNELQNWIKQKEEIERLAGEGIVEIEKDGR